MLHYLRWPLLFTMIGLSLAFWVGYRTSGSMSDGFAFLLIGTVLAVLEISLSFDNAIVNANKLQDMSPVWQRRFLTWGILIAVFGMRIIFPLAVVSIAAHINPWAAVVLAANEPQEYARIMQDAHLSIAAFGGTFLMMVGLSFFLDEEKDIHWVKFVEEKVHSWASIRGLEIAFVLTIVLLFTVNLPEEDGNRFLFAAVGGLLTYLAVNVLGSVLDASKEAKAGAATGGFGAFLYLEVLDASFSFDGVIGAFALTQNLFLIAIGLGIGAFYVRSITIMLVEKQTLSEFRYLEHGAFYSILALSVFMLTQSVMHVSEMITGLTGVCLIGLALYSSIRHNRKAKQSAINPVA